VCVNLYFWNCIFFQYKSYLARATRAPVVF